METTMKIRVTARPEVPWKSTYEIPKQHHFADDPVNPGRLIQRKDVKAHSLKIGVPTEIEVDPRLLADLKLDPFLTVEELDEVVASNPEKGQRVMLTADERQEKRRAREEQDEAAGRKPQRKTGRRNAKRPPPGEFDN